MGLFFVYILKSSLCLALFYLFYRLLLSRETFHRFNRFALLGILLFSCLLPLVEVSMPPENEVHQTMLTLEQWMLLADAPNGATIQRPEATVSWIQLAMLLYFGGILFFVFRHIYSFFRMMMLLKSSKREDMNPFLPGNRRATLIVHSQDIAPFSWMKYIVISQKDLAENGREILIHELAHIRNRHSWDLLVAEVCILCQWLNPASWLLKQELQNIHEYEADETVINEGVDAKQYQLLLIKKAVGTRLYSMANSFNHSKLKKRITMMLKEKSSPWACLKYLYVLPVAAIAVTAFARPEVSRQAEEVSKMSDALKSEQVDALFARLREVSAAKVNDLAANDETKVAENALAVLKQSKTTTLQGDTVKSDKEEQISIRISANPNEEVLQKLNNARNEVVTGKSIGVEPLYVVDGKEVPSSVMGALRADAIESISVLKGDAATQVYGEKGKDGVMLITLKKEGLRVVGSVGNQKKTTEQRTTTIVSSTISDSNGTRMKGSISGLEGVTVYIDKVKTDLKGRKLEDVIPADQIESISVSKSVTLEDGTGTEHGAVYITTKKAAKSSEK